MEITYDRFRVGRTMDQQLVRSIFKWFVETDPRFYKIHLSRTGLDGFGCQLVTNIVSDMMDHVQKPHPIVYMNMGYSKKSKVNAITHSVSKSMRAGYEKGKDILAILVTGVSGDDLDNEFQRLRDDGHKLYVLNIDHHPHSETKDRSCVVENYTDEVIHINDTSGKKCYNRTNVMYINTLVSSMRILFEAIDNPHIHWDDYGRDQEIIVDRLDYLSHYISISDNGKWEDWYDTQEACYLEASIKERLYFEYFRSRRKCVQWIYNQYAILTNGTKFIPKYLRGHFSTDTVMSEYDNIIRQEYHVLQKDYRRFSDMYDLIDIDKIFPELMDLTVGVMRIRSVKDSSPYLSLISTEILADDIRLDMLVIIDYPRNNVELRGNPTQINCSAIAAKYGGGGQPGAAGFPLPDMWKD